MVRKHAKLEKIDHNRVITQEQDSEFLNNLRKGLLLALREQGILNGAQYQRAEKQLLKQHAAKENGT